MPIPPPAPGKTRKRLLIVTWTALGLLTVLCGMWVFGLTLPDKPADQHTGNAALGTVPRAATAAAPASKPTLAAVPRVTTAPASTPTKTTAAAPATSEICEFASNGGHYYLFVTSATDYDFSACNGGQAYSGTIQQLVTDGSGIDRRCILGLDATIKFDAIVGVYSSPARVDAAAAIAFCTANGGDS
jgi:hypothetical protein